MLYVSTHRETFKIKQVQVLCANKVRGTQLAQCRKSYGTQPVLNFYFHTRLGRREPVIFSKCSSSSTSDVLYLRRSQATIQNRLATVTVLRRDDRPRQDHDRNRVDAGGGGTCKGTAAAHNTVDDCRETSRCDCILIAFVAVDITYIVHVGTGLWFESTSR